jgi:hypothetical protein
MMVTSFPMNWITKGNAPGGHPFHARRAARAAYGTKCWERLGQRPRTPTRMR